MAELAEEGYLAVAFDSHAWYRIMENLERVASRVQSALVLMRYVACTKIESFRKLDASRLNERMEKLIAELSGAD